LKTDFNIAKEVMVNYESNDPLWLMLIQMRNTFIIQIDNRNTSVGHKVVDCRLNAEELYNQLSITLKRCEDMQTAIDLIKATLNYSSFQAILFTIYTYHIEFDWIVLCRLRGKFGFRTEPHNEEFIWDTPNLGHRINVFFKNPVSIGRFQAISKVDNTKFIFLINPDYR
jgi:hypothetical protein